MKSMIAFLAFVLLAAGLTFAASSQTRQVQDKDAPPLHQGPWPIYNGFNHQPTEQDLPPSVRRDEGHVTPSESDFDKSLEICRPC